MKAIKARAVNDLETLFSPKSRDNVQEADDVHKLSLIFALIRNEKMRLKRDLIFYPLFIWILN